MIKEIEVSEINEKDNSEEMEREQYINDNSRENWDLSGDILDCFKRYSNELSVEERKELNVQKDKTSILNPIKDIKIVIHLVIFLG